MAIEVSAEEGFQESLERTVPAFLVVGDVVLCMIFHKMMTEVNLRLDRALPGSIGSIGCVGFAVAVGLAFAFPLFTAL